MYAFTKIIMLPLMFCYRSHCVTVIIKTRTKTSQYLISINDYIVQSVCVFLGCAPG